MTLSCRGNVSPFWYSFVKQLILRGTGSPPFDEPISSTYLWLSIGYILNVNQRTWRHCRRCATRNGCQITGDIITGRLSYVIHIILGPNNDESLHNTISMLSTCNRKPNIIHKIQVSPCQWVQVITRIREKHNVRNNSENNIHIFRKIWYVHPANNEPWERCSTQLWADQEHRQFTWPSPP